MLVLFESPAGYGLFKCDEKVMKANKEDIFQKYFADKTKLNKFKLKAFAAFADTAEAVAAATSAVEGSVNKKLGKFLKKNVESSDTLLIADQKMSEGIKDKVSNLNIISNELSQEVRTTGTPDTLYMMYMIYCIYRTCALKRVSHNTRHRAVC